MNDDFSLGCPYSTVLELLLLNNCKPDTIAVIHATCICTEYNQGDEIFHIHTPAQGVHIICHGSIKLTRRVTEFYGRREVTTGGVIGLESLHHHTSYETSARAISNSCVAFIPRDVILRLIENDSAFRINLLFASCSSGYTVEKHGVESGLYHS